MKDGCRIIINCEQGVVVFLPSIGYAEEVHKAWRVSGLLPQLASEKQIFTEPREGSQVEVVLKEYGACIAAKPGLKAEGEEQQRGAVLLCVVGGKMSEGINFGDGLGRCGMVCPLSLPS
jgi:chromosome transmission fidelity protein 1